MSRLLAVLVILFLGSMLAPLIATAGTTITRNTPKAGTLEAHQPIVSNWKSRAERAVLHFSARVERLLPKAWRAQDGRPTDTFAIVSLCCGIGGYIVPVLGSIAAIVFGVLALRRIRESGDAGKGLAIAGIILGGLGLLFFVAYFALLIALM